MSDQLQKLVQDVAVLKEQNATSGDIHGRLDNAIDKLTDIQSGIKSMLAVHEARIERAEESDVEMAKLNSQIKNIQSQEPAQMMTQGRVVMAM